MTIGCVVFDLDDTLYLERDYVHSGFLAVGEVVARASGCERFAEVAWKLFEEGARHSTFDDALSQLGIEHEADFVAELVDAYRAHVPAIELLPDAVDCLAELRSTALLGVLTDGPAASQRAKAIALRVHEWSAACVLTDELGSGFGKPDPRAFRLVEELAGYAGEQCTYVADNPAKDFEAPIQLGWHTVRVRRTGSLHASVDSRHALDGEVTDLGGLPSILARLSS